MESLCIAGHDLCPRNGFRVVEYGYFAMNFKHIRTSVTLLLILTVLTGLVYPLVITGIAQLVFPVQANGSLVVRDGQVIGSALIGQQFKDPGYFWGRRSSTGPTPYNASASGGSNQGPINPALVTSVREKINELRSADTSNTQLIPIDLVTSSGSGLDPHISVSAAQYQVARVARARGVPAEQIGALVRRIVEGRQFGILGEARVNVLILNLELDRMSRAKGEK
jgi:K+-transporting ATPase ATPase C chain